MKTPEIDKLSRDTTAVREDLEHLAQDGVRLASDAAAVGRERLDVVAEETVVADFLLVSGLVESIEIGGATAVRVAEVLGRRSLRSLRDSADALESAVRAEDLASLAEVPLKRLSAAAVNASEGLAEVAELVYSAHLETWSNWRERAGLMKKLIGSDWA